MKAESRYAATELIRRERFIGEIYDAHHIDDGIAEAFIQNGNAIFITSQDFLANQNRGTNVVTAPPIRLGAAYARTAISLCTDKVALLLPIRWMTTPEAKTLFEETPLARIYVLTKRLRYHKDGNRLAPMAWYLWQKGHFEGPMIRWI